MKCPQCRADNPETQRFCGECGTRLPPEASTPGQAPGPAAGRSPSPPEHASFTRTLETTSDELTRGTLFAGRYEVIEELGQGGMGRVYRVFDSRIKEEVALKFLRPEVAASPRTLERFRNEIRLARKIVHKNVCRMFDMGEERGTPFITMEYVAGEDLKSFIRRVGHLPVGKTVHLGREIAEGLTEAHKTGVVHRDLKPGNIMIDRNGDAKIMDFGIARSLAGGGTTAEGAIIGTPEYMSPEQVEGKEVDRRTDIYALGIILFEMVTGRAPFEGTTPFSVANKQKSEPPPDPATLNPQVPADLGRIILRCLEKPAEARYQTTVELLADLAAVEAALPTTDGTTERAAGRTPSRVKPKTSREITVKLTPRKVIIPAAAILVLAGAFLLWRFAIHPQPGAVPAASAAPTLAVLDFENLSQDESLDFWRGGLPELLITGLYQSRFINVLTRDRADAILKKLGLAEARKYTSDDLARIAAEGRITRIVTGSYLKAGGKILITLTLQEPRTQKIIERMRVECRDQDDILSKADDLTLQVKRDLNLSEEQLSVDAQVYTKLEAATTSSAEAYRFYIEGWKYIKQGKAPESIPMIEKALVLDPQFAMAHRLLGIAYSNVGRNAEGRRSIEKAMALKDRIPEREQYLIEAQFYANRGERYFDRVIDAYSNYLKLYPEDLVWYSNLGGVYFRFEEWDKALDLFERSRKGEATNVIPLINSALTFEARGEYATAEDLLGQYLRRFPESTMIHRYLAATLILAGKFDLASAEVQKAEAQEPGARQNTLLRGDIALYRGDLVVAESEYRKLAEMKDTIAQRQSSGRLSWLANLEGKFAALRAQMGKYWEKPAGGGGSVPPWPASYLSAWYFLRSGDPGTALKCFQQVLDQAVKAEDPDGQREALLGKGMACLALDRTDEARGAAEELKKVIEGGLYKKSIQLYDYLTGCIELKRNNLGQAVESLEKAVSLMPHEYDAWTFGPQALRLEALARAYAESGQEAKALETYRRITGLTNGRIAWGDIYARSFYQIGRILEKRGDRGQAATNYRRFLDLWKDADPGLPEIEEARKRLAGL